MATGEKKFSSSGRKVQSGFTIPAPGEYEAKLIAGKAEVKIGQSETSLPRVAGVRFELLGTEQGNGKNQLVFHDFYTSLVESPKDNKAMVDRTGQIVDFSKAIGEDVECGIVQVKNSDCLSAKELLQWLKNRDGAVLKLKVKHEKGQNDQVYAKVDRFIEGSGASASGGVDEDYEVDDDTEVEEDEDDLPPPPTSKKKTRK